MAIQNDPSLKFEQMIERISSLVEGYDPSGQPNRKVAEPLGTREDYIRDRNSYDG